jgi:hypothetical protein
MFAFMLSALVLPAALGSPSTSVVIRCARSPRGFALALSGAVVGTFTFESRVAAEVAAGEWFDANLGNGRLVEIHGGSRLVGIAERPPMARALLARALRLLR